MNYSIKATGNLKEYISGKDLAHGHMIFVDPSYKLIGVMVLEGHIKIIPIDNDYKDAYELRLELLRKTNIADSISYLDNGIVFIGSGGNASQLIKLNQYPNSEGSYIDVIEVYSNQGYINGSLQIIRNEIGINIQASIELVDTGLTIGLLDNIQKISVSSYPIEGTPKKISYHNSTGTYIVLVENISSTNDNALETKYSVNFYTNTSNTFDLIQSFALNPLEHAIACSSCYVSRKSSDEVNSLEYVIVGTAYELINEIEPSTGRLLVFKLSIKQDESKSVELLYELDVNGGVFAIESCLGRIITCQGSKIVVYSIEDSLIEDLNELTNYPVELIEESSVSSNLNASTNKLIELGKDFSSIYLRAIEILLPDLYFGCDDSGNIFTLKFNGITDNSASSSVVDNTTINNKKLLDHDDDNPGVSKSFLFGTISGYI
eukprot:gene18728-24492_t